MKPILILITLIFCVSSCKAQTEKKVVSKEIIEILTHDKFNLKIYELSFCLSEIFYIIENDSSNYKFLAERINKAFNSTINEDVLYINSLEYEFLMRMIEENTSLKNYYPEIHRKIKQITPPLTLKVSSNFSEIFKNYIKYPEQVDDICLIMMICKIDCKAFEDVMNDKLSLYEYNNWLDYGFDEFRYYPGTLNKGKGIINNRIVDYIMKTKNCQDYSLANKSILMIKSTIGKY